MALYTKPSSYISTLLLRYICRQKNLFFSLGFSWINTPAMLSYTCNLGKRSTYDKIIIVLNLTYRIISFIRPSAAHAVCERFLTVFPWVLSITLMNGWVLNPPFKIWNLKWPWCPSIGYDKARITKTLKRMKLCWDTFTFSVFKPRHDTGREKKAYVSRVYHNDRAPITDVFVKCQGKTDIGREKKSYASRV